MKTSTCIVFSKCHLAHVPPAVGKRQKKIPQHHIYKRNILRKKSTVDKCLPKEAFAYDSLKSHFSGLIPQRMLFNFCLYLILNTAGFHLTAVLFTH